MAIRILQDGKRGTHNNSSVVASDTIASRRLTAKRHINYVILSLLVTITYLMYENFTFLDWKQITYYSRSSSSCTSFTSNNNKEGQQLNNQDGNSNTKRRKTKITDGCYHVYLDVGSNIGVHNRFLFEPSKYPKARKALQLFKDEFGSTDDRDNRDICAVGFEPNPNHYERHQTLQEVYATQGWKYIPMHEGVSDQDGNITFYHRNVKQDSQNKEVGFSTVNRNDGTTPVIVPVRRLSTFLLEEVVGRQLPDRVYGNYSKFHGGRPRVVMKMDIESHEYYVLPDIITSGALCQTVDFIFGEFHKWNNIQLRKSNKTVSGGDAVTTGRQFLTSIQNAANCKTTWKELDDESYLNDGIPYPT